MAGTATPISSRSVVATGLSGEAFTYSAKPDPKMPPHDTWHKLPADNPYRKEWDSFARDLGLNPRNANNFPAIKEAMGRYVDAVLSAKARGVPPRETARADAIRETKAQLFEPKTTEKLQALTGPRGGLTQAGRAGVAALANDPALLQTPWGASFQASVQNIRTQASFAAGFVEGVWNGGKDMVVGLATVAGKTAQYLTDSTLGLVVDPIRSLLPTSAQSWMRASEAIPSAERSRATTQRMVDAVSNAASYIANNTPEQVGADIKSFVSQNWDSLKASHAEAAAKGPEAEAHWWGQVTGRAAFEVAAVVVPVTKIALLSKADKAGDLVRIGDAGGDVGRVAGAAGKEIAESLLDRATRILGDLPLNSNSLDELYQAGKMTMAEAHSLAKSVGWKEANGRWIYPPDEGFHNGYKEITIKKGDQILMDRYGRPTGGFTSPVGESIGGRALPPSTDFSQANYHVYKVIEDIDVQIGRATPWFDQPGGAIQYRLSESIEDLVLKEKMIEVGK